MMGNQYTEMIEELVERGKELEAKNLELTSTIAGSNFNAFKDNNPIEFQIENVELLAKVEHFLKGDLVRVDKEGNEYYEAPSDEELILLNEYGVTSLMGIISGYIDKNTTLSYYSEERIYEIMADLGDKLSDFIYWNYEKMGLNSEWKKTRYPILVLQIIQMIESAYRRALNGNQADIINTSKIFTQHDSGYNKPQQSMKRKFNPLNYKTW